MKIATVSLLNNIPLNTGGKSASFFVNNTVWKYHKLNFYYFYQENNQEWEIPNWINFTSKYIKKKFKFSFFPDLLQKMNYEFILSKWELKDIKADIVLLEFPYLYHLAKIISKNNNNCPIYLLAHNIEYQYYKRENSKLWRFIKIFEEYIFKKVTKIICISKHDCQHIKKLWLNNVNLMKLWVSDEIYNLNWQSYNFNNNKFNILFYWSLKASFNQNALKFIYNDLCPNLWNDFLVNVCWKNVNNIQDKENIKFHWFVEKLEDYIRWCDVVIVPIKETVWINMRILESLYCWKIVLASSSSMKWLDVDLEKLVFKCDTVDDYINILEKLQKDKKYRLACEKDIKEAISNYIANWEEILKDIFIK